MKTSIKSTTNYSLFQPLKGNRNVNRGHVMRIKESMKKQMLPTFIEVNERYEVIDGQHRLEALKELGLPVYYIVNEGSGLREAQRHNEIKRKWGYADIMSSHCAAENENYLFIQYLVNKYSLTIDNALIACKRGINGQRLNYDFQQGELEIKNKKEIEELIRQALRVNAVVNIMRKTAWSAILQCIDSKFFDIDVFIRKLTYLKDQFTPQVTKKQQIAQIEEIYNYKNRNKVNLRITK
jgi:hypothetical protein